MNTTKKIKIRGKILIYFSAIIFAIVISFILSVSNIRKMNKNQSEVIKMDKIVYNLSQIRADENRYKVLTYELMLNKDRNRIKKIVDELRKKEEEIKSKFAEAASILELYPQFNDNIDSIKANAKIYFANNLKISDLINQNKDLEAYNLLTQEQDSLYNKIRLEGISLEKEMVKLRASIMTTSENITNHVTVELLIIGIILIIITLSLEVVVLKMFSKISEELSSGIDIISSSAAGILETVNDVSTGASETATAVSETTTTIEEVRQTATVANQKAQALIESSQKAADSAEKGKMSIQNAEDAIKNIDAQMKMISDTVLRLAEQNRAIGEITSTVSDIADQSNLLAVNAAIEAAKAGEHGRGFTIVAQEIRTLADQSKRATKQVKDILNEVNKSVNQAVGVTEQGARTVEKGLVMVHQNSEIIDLLAENVDDTVQVSMQISSSNYQQMAGMDQIVPAMENIKKASEQNIKGIQLAQNASHDIDKLGKALKEIIEKYNL